MSPILDPDNLADPRRWSLGSPTLSDSQAGGGRLEPGGAGLAGVRLKDDFTHSTPMGWYLSAKLFNLFSPERKIPLYQELEWVQGLIDTQGAEGLWMQLPERAHFPFRLCDSLS